MLLYWLGFLTTLVASWDPLVGSNVSPQAQSLFRRLENYHQKYILSGQTSDNYESFKSEIGASPLIRGFDMQNYSPHNPWYNWNGYDDGTIGKAIAWHKSTQGKGISTFYWHWFSPSGGQLRTSTFYTNNTNFDVNRAVDPNTAEHNQTIRDIDAIAVQLKRLQAEKIPVLWRPLHEAGGGWFWWGAKGSSPAKKLLEMIFSRLNDHHKINNLIWVWSTPEEQWYPGKNRVDIIGYDSYPGSHNYACNYAMYDRLKKMVGGSKMVTMSQNGPIPDIDKCFSEGANWSWFMSWSTLVNEQNDLSHLKLTYANPKVRTVERS